MSVTVHIVQQHSGHNVLYSSTKKWASQNCHCVLTIMVRHPKGTSQVLPKIFVMAKQTSTLHNGCDSHEQVGYVVLINYPEQCCLFLHLFLSGGAHNRDMRSCVILCLISLTLLCKGPPHYSGHVKYV